MSGNGTLPDGDPASSTGINAETWGSFVLGPKIWSRKFYYIRA